MNKEISNASIVKLFVITIMLSVGLLCAVNSPVKPENNSEIIISYQESKYECVSSETIQTENITTGEITERYISKITKIDDTDNNKNITTTTDQKLIPDQKYIRIIANLQTKSENGNNYSVTKYSDYISYNENSTEIIASEKEKVKQICLEELKTLQSQPKIDSQQTSIFNLMGLSAIAISIIVLIRTFAISEKTTKAELKNNNNIEKKSSSKNQKN